MTLNVQIGAWVRRFCLNEDETTRYRPIIGVYRGGLKMRVRDALAT